MISDWKSTLSALLPEDYTPDNNEQECDNTSGQVGALRIELDKKRAGKTATIISGFTLTEEKVAEIARLMKQKLGVGGSHRNGEILIQGDRRQAAADFLKARGYKSKII